MKSLFVPIALLALSATVFLFSCARSGRTTEERAPRIVNLILKGPENEQIVDLIDVDDNEFTD